MSHDDPDIRPINVIISTFDGFTLVKGPEYRRTVLCYRAFSHVSTLFLFFDFFNTICTEILITQNVSKMQ
jgi:hypothetical protein